MKHRLLDYEHTNMAPVIPKFYWDIESQEERILFICKEIARIVCYMNKQTDAVNELEELYNQLKAEFEQFKVSGFEDYYEELLIQYLHDNGERLIKEMLGFCVFFGLSMDGYFMAYYPESWNDIEFDTGAVYGHRNYGRLILKY